MIDAKEQAFIDAQTWMPVAFFSYVVTHYEAKFVGSGVSSGEVEPVTELHQLWVSALGQTEWRKVETRNLKEMAKAYGECQTFNDNPDDGEF